MTFILNKNLAFVDSMPFMNSSLEKLVKYLADNDFKYLTQEFDSKSLELLKQKGAYPYESTWIVLKDLEKRNCLIKNVFTDL